MKLGRITTGLLVIGVLAFAPSSMRAEEIILKDGQKIVGTIVGYEKDMFRVETDYGIALVRKDKVASIQVTKPDAAKAPTSSTATDASTHTPGPLSATPGPLPVLVPRPRVPVTLPKPLVPPVIRMPDPTRLPKGSASPALGFMPVGYYSSPGDPPPPPPPVSHPLEVPMPAQLEEHVDGNTYFSDTFRFSMYKPPDWKVYEGVPKETGSGIMAMGTEDEQTLLIVDRQVWSGAPKLASNQVEANLRQPYQEYHRISEDAFQCDGQAAIRRTFTGVMDGAEWHGVAVHVIQGNTVFGIIGLTSSETFQFQEAIFNKIIKTFHFLNSTSSPVSLQIANPGP